MKLFVVIAVSVIVCCNAQTKNEEPVMAVRLLEAILNETRATRELQNLIIDELRSARKEAQYCCRMSHTQSNVFVSFASCEDIKTMSPSAPSGYYNITKHDGTTERVYCDMEHSHLSCNGIEDSHLDCVERCGSTGWAKIANLNMSDPSQQCPTELKPYNVSGVRACGRQTSGGASCDSVTFSTNGVSYSEVSGRVIGYQNRTPNAVETGGGIDSPYVDGVSITHGSPPRQHIWTFMGGLRDSFTTAYDCPCNSGSTISVPSFVGHDYFCESANPLSSWPYIFYPDDPLWDGEDCGGLESPCCTGTCFPWFHKVLDSPTTDNIELRVCGDQDTNNEDTPISLYEIYIK